MGRWGDINRFDTETSEIKGCQFQIGDHIIDKKKKKKTPMELNWA